MQSRAVPTLAKEGLQRKKKGKKRRCGTCGREKKEAENCLRQRSGLRYKHKEQVRCVNKILVCLLFLIFLLIN